MITHAFNAPIAPGVLRVSVIADDELYAADFPTAKLAETLRTFEHYAGTDASVAHTPQATEACREKAAEAVEDGDAYLVTTAALWLFLKQPGARHEMNWESLTAMIRENGACMLTVSVTQRSGWDFRLFAMPRWPAVVAPYRATQRDRRRR
jgi:hypothetical protein